MRHVGAGEEQHKTERAQQQDKCPRDVLDYGIAQLLYGNNGTFWTGGTWKLSPEFLGDALHLSLCHLQGSTGFQARGTAVHVREIVAIGIHLRRKPDLRRRVRGETRT